MTPVAVQVTRHALKRVHERLGLPRRAVARAAALALRNGLSTQDARRGLSRYLNAKATQNAELFRVYRGAVFAFAMVGDTAHLITAWPLNKEFQA